MKKKSNITILLTIRRTFPKCLRSLAQKIKIDRFLVILNDYEKIDPEKLAVHTPYVCIGNFLQIKTISQKLDNIYKLYKNCLIVCT